MIRLTCSRDEAKSKIEKQIEAGEDLLSLTGQAWDSGSENWNAYNETLLETLFDDSKPIDEYRSIQVGMPIMHSLSDGPRLAAEAWRETIERRLNRLKSFVSRLELYEEPDSSNSTDSLRPLASTGQFHSDVQRYAGPLVADGHFAEAIRKAAQHLHNRVRVRARELDPSVENLDGVTLVSRVFSDEPLIPLTPRGDESERDEHKGYRFLFMGVMAALRNPRSHETDDWADRDDDPIEVYEWLGLISALHRVLDKALENRDATS